MPEDDLARGIVGIHIVWEWTQERSGGRKRRLDDQLQFFAETMYRFNQEMARYLREELGCKQLINAGNWKTADTTRLNDVERWSYTANEVLAVNNYYSPVHIGPDRGWRIDKGDHFEDVSALVNPRALPLNLKQVSGHPMMVTESHWVPPLGYQSEGPFLVAAYQSLTGVDVFYWFSTGETEWSSTDCAEWDAASRQKWSIATPMVAGPVSGRGARLPQGIHQAGRAGGRRAPVLAAALGPRAPLDFRGPELRPQPRPGRFGPAVVGPDRRRPARLPGRARESRRMARTRARRRSPT